MKRIFILALLALLTITVYGQTDSTKVKKKKKIDWVSVHGTVADSFTKMGILDVKNHPDGRGLDGDKNFKSLRELWLQ